MEYTVHKCNTHEVQCEKFFNYVDTDFCPALLNNIVMGDTFSKFTIPPFKCPIKKGQYVSSKMLVNMSQFDLLPFDDKNKWDLRFNFYQKSAVSGSNEVQLGCWYLQMSRTTGSYKKRGVNARGK